MRIYCSLILSCLLLLSSCTTKPSIEGIWMGVYDMRLEEDARIYNLSRLLDISSNQIVTKQLDYELYNGIDTVWVDTYFLKDSIIYRGEDTLFIKKLTADDLEVVIHSKGSKLKRGFKRIKNKRKGLKPDLTNKAFSFAGNSFADSLDFLSDSTMFSMGSGRSKRIRPWTFTQYKGLDFLILYETFSVPFLIESVAGDSVQLSGFYKDRIPFKMKQLHYKSDTTGLLGDWVFPYEKYNFRFLSAITNRRYSEDNRFFLNIDKDTITMRYFGRWLKRSYQLNSTHEYIHFNKNRRSEGLLNIYELNSKSLIIDKPYLRYFYFASSDTTRFERLKK